MTDKVNFSKKRYTSVKTKALPIYLIAMSTLIAITSIVTFASEHSVNAQVIGGNTTNTIK
jgi:hypothetical protein